MGRLAIWTQSAFRQLDKIYGTYKTGSSKKTGFHLPIPKMVNSDMGRLLHCRAVLSALKSRRMYCQKPGPKVKKNPLKNSQVSVVFVFLSIRCFFVYKCLKRNE